MNRLTHCLTAAESTGDIEPSLLERAKDALNALQKEKTAALKLKTVVTGTEHEVGALQIAIEEARVYEALAKDVAAAEEVLVRWQSETPCREELENAILARDSARLHAAIAEAEKHGINVKSAKKMISTLQREDEVMRCMSAKDLPSLKRAIGAAVASEADKDVIARAQKFLSEQMLVLEAADRTERLRALMANRDINELQLGLSEFTKNDIDETVLKEAQELLIELLKEQDMTRNLRRAMQDEGHDIKGLTKVIAVAESWPNLVEMVTEAREKLDTWKREEVMKRDIFKAMEERDAAKLAAVVESAEEIGLDATDARVLIKTLKTEEELSALMASPSVDSSELKRMILAAERSPGVLGDLIKQAHKKLSDLQKQQKMAEAQHELSTAVSSRSIERLTTAVNNAQQIGGIDRSFMEPALATLKALKRENEAKLAIEAALRDTSRDMKKLGQAIDESARFPSLASQVTQGRALLEVWTQEAAVLNQLATAMKAPNIDDLKAALRTADAMIAATGSSVPPQLTKLCKEAREKLQKIAVQQQLIKMSAVHQQQASALGSSALQSVPPANRAAPRPAAAAASASSLLGALQPVTLAASRPLVAAAAASRLPVADPLSFSMFSPSASSAAPAVASTLISDRANSRFADVDRSSDRYMRPLSPQNGVAAERVTTVFNRGAVNTNNLDSMSSGRVSSGVLHSSVQQPRFSADGLAEARSLRMASSDTLFSGSNTRASSDTLFSGNPATSSQAPLLWGFDVPSAPIISAQSSAAPRTNPIVINTDLDVSAKDFTPLYSRTSAIGSTVGGLSVSSVAAVPSSTVIDSKPVPTKRPGSNILSLSSVAPPSPAFSTPVHASLAMPTLSSAQTELSPMNDPEVIPKGDSAHSLHSSIGNGVIGSSAARGTSRLAMYAMKESPSADTLSTAGSSQDSRFSDPEPWMCVDPPFT
jgi:hypothetical protein